VSAGMAASMFLPDPTDLAAVLQRRSVGHGRLVARLDRRLKTASTEGLTRSLRKLLQTLSAPEIMEAFSWADQTRGCCEAALGERETALRQAIATIGTDGGGSFLTHPGAAAGSSAGCVIERHGGTW